VAEDQADNDTARRRAKWEATVRAGKSQEATLVVPGWRRAGGALWLPQAAVDLEAPSAWMQGAMMVAGVKLALDANGRRAELRIVRPEAYTQLPVPEDAEASRVRRGDRRQRRRRERQHQEKRDEA
jgi:prophage tail gpP-like protein